MLRVRHRIERLEEEMLPLPFEPPEFMHLHFVDSEKRVVDTIVFEMAQTLPPGRRWRTAQRWPPAKGGR
jgi:hypothetical protein